MRLDRSAGTWDLYVNGAMVEADLGLDPNSGQQLVLFGETSAPVYVDDVYAGSTNPLFVDVNGDGLPDAWVRAQTGSLVLPTNPRGWSVSSGVGGASGGNETLLQEYMQTVAALGANSTLYAQPIVFVHPSIRSWSDLATLLQAINTVAPINDANAEGFLVSLVAALNNAQQASLAGLPSPNWQFASDLDSATQIASNGATLVVFPGPSPYIVPSLDTHGKQITFDCLEGAVISTPEAAAQAQGILAHKRATLIEGLATNPGGTGATASTLASLWPVTTAQ
jgi:hypothetical protein